MRKSTIIYILLFIIILLLILFYFKGCRTYAEPARHIPVDMSQVILARNPDSSHESFKKYLADHFPYDRVDMINYCSSCDSDLVMVSGADVVLYLQGQTTSGGSGGKTSGLKGGDGPVLISYNFPIEIIDSIYAITDSIKQIPIPYDSTPRKGYNIGSVNRTNTNSASNIFSGTNLPIPPQLNFTEADTVTVAVFDTGLDSVMFNNYLYKNDIASCLNPLANNGWNFYSETPDWKDDYSPPHGTIVSRFIIDQANKYHKNFVKILPVKLHGSNGVSHLYDVLCAMSYAKNRGANIINASFGFYAPITDADAAHPDSSVLVFRKFLTKYLNDPEHVMLMIAAAGNKDDTDENYVYSSADPVARRNLDSVSLYPASFARDIPNVIAVTTISEKLKTVSPHQNFSANVVDIGVNADTVVHGDSVYLFINPITDNSIGIATVEGSSFATPVAAGSIAANYYLIKNLLTPGAYNAASKQKLLDVLKNNGILQTGDAAFKDKIKNRKVMTK